MDSADRSGRSRSKSPHSTHSSSTSQILLRGREDSRRSRSFDRKERSRSPERSRTGDRKRFPGQDTNSNDPKSVRSRVFVGNLGNVNKEEIIEHFEQFGKVIGVSIHANFGFIQYSNEKAADIAVEKTHGTTVFGKRVDCNIASERRKPQAKDSEDDVPKTRRYRSPESGHGRSVSPRSEVGYQKSPSPRSRYDELMRRDYNRSNNLDLGSPGRFMDRYPEDRYRRSKEDESSWYSVDGSLPSTGSGYSRPLARRLRPAHDCEIVITSKGVGGYGELIESRLRSIGVLSKMVLPQPDVSLSETLDQVAQRGTLYSLLITETNELHRSCTLNILHGTPQEHRNMPLEDALALVARNFESYLRALKEPGSFHSHSQEPGHKTSLVQNAEVASLLKLAACGRILTIGEIDKLIDALRKYRAELESNDKPGNGNSTDIRRDKGISGSHHVGYPFSGSLSYESSRYHPSVSSNAGSGTLYP